MLALMTPGFLLAVGTQLFWNYLGLATSIWKTALGANVVWGIPFGFLVMLSVWNRYDPRIEEAARDLGADQRRTFREVTLPLVWTGIFGCFLFGFTLTWNEFIYALTFVSQSTSKTAIVGVTADLIRGDIYYWGSLMAGAVLAWRGRRAGGAVAVLGIAATLIVPAMRSGRFSAVMTSTLAFGRISVIRPSRLRPSICGMCQSISTRSNDSALS